MQRAHARAVYTGFPAPMAGGFAHQHGAPGHGFCAGCGHPRSDCCCGCRQCMKEAKELLVQPTTSGSDLKNATGASTAAERMAMFTSFAHAVEGLDAAAKTSPDALLTSGAIREGRVGLQSGFIGGGCCVHVSVEYTPAGAADGLVAVVVKDQDTELAWLKKVSPGLGYQIKEGVVTTKPGAQLAVMAIGATLRARWCEVFSC